MGTPLKAPGPDVSVASHFLGPTATFLALDIILYAARMYSRIWPVKRLGLDDLFCTVAVGLMLTFWALTARAVNFGMGRHNFYVPVESQIQGAHFLFASQPIWGWSVAFAKISMACMMLRIIRDKRWRIFLYVLIAVQVLTAFGLMLILVLQCRPISAIWNPFVPNANCWSPLPSQIAIYASGGVSIVTDIIFTLLPLTFISKMNLPLRQKIVLGTLMGLGLFAAAAGIVKLTLVNTYTHGGDSLFHMVDLYMWGYLEQEMSIIALCVPCLKAPFEKVLRRLKLVTSSGGRSGEGKTRSGYVTFGNSNRSGNAQQHELESVRSRAVRGDVETASQETILRKDVAGIMKTTELTFETSTLKDADSFRQSER